MRISDFIFLCFFLVLSHAHEASARQSTLAAFSPSPKAIELVVHTIEAAKDSIDVAAYSFASEKVSDALIASHERGVTIRVVLDKSHAARRYPAVEALHEAGIAIRINHHYAIMHNKYLIIDDVTVETGSFNFTANAERRNAENVLVIKNNKTLASKYREDWDKLWDEGVKYE